MTKTVKNSNEHAMEESKGREAGKASEWAAHAVSVQLPKFTRTSPRSWFRICDAHFNVRGVTASDTRYWHAVAKLDSDTLEEIQEFLEADLGTDPYTDLKRHLCEVFEATPQQKLDQFLATNSMGDKRPSAFLRELQRLVAGMTMQRIVRRVFTRSLPPRIATAIASNRQASLEELGKDADEAWAEGIEDSAASPTVAAIARPASRGRGFRPRGGAKAHHQNERQATGELCPYHAKWGDDARRCLSSCPLWSVKSLKQRPTKVFHIEEEEDDEIQIPEN